MGRRPRTQAPGGDRRHKLQDPGRWFAHPALHQENNKTSKRTLSRQIILKRLDTSSSYMEVLPDKELILLVTSRLPGKEIVIISLSGPDRASPERLLDKEIVIISLSGPDRDRRSDKVTSSLVELLLVDS